MESRRSRREPLCGETLSYSNIVRHETLRRQLWNPGGGSTSWQGSTDHKRKPNAMEQVDGFSCKAFKASEEKRTRSCSLCICLHQLKLDSGYPPNWGIVSELGIIFFDRVYDKVDVSYINQLGFWVLWLWIIEVCFVWRIWLEQPRIGKSFFPTTSQA